MPGQVVAENALLDLRMEPRRWCPFLVDVGHLVMWVTPLEQRNAKLLDESFGGIGVVMDDASGLEPGRELDLTYEGVAMRGVIRSVTPYEEGRHRVGIEWAPNAGHDPEVRDATAHMLGRLRILFRMREEGTWTELARGVECLRREAETLHLEPVAQHAATLLALLEETPLTPLSETLAALVDACLNTDGGTD